MKYISCIRIINLYEIEFLILNIILRNFIVYTTHWTKTSRVKFRSLITSDLQTYIRKLYIAASKCVNRPLFKLPREAVRYFPLRKS